MLLNHFSLGMHPEEVKSESSRNVRTPVFVAAVFAMAEIQKQPKCPSIDLNTAIHTYTHKHLQQNC